MNRESESQRRGVRQVRAGLVVVVLALVGLSQPLAEVELVLNDGRRLTGTDLDRQENVVVLTLGPTGESTIALPVDLVREIRLTGGLEDDAVPSATGRPVDPLPPPTEDRVPGSEVPLSEAELPPAELRSGVEEAEKEEEQDEYLTQLDLPERAAWRSHSFVEQFAAFRRDPSIFPAATIPPTWHYQDELGQQTDVTQFNPSLLPYAPYDPTWRPESEYESPPLLPDFNSSRWYRTPLLQAWYPRDGWSGETE